MGFSSIQKDFVENFFFLAGEVSSVLASRAFRQVPVLCGGSNGWVQYASVHPQRVQSHRCQGTLRERKKKKCLWASFKIPSNSQKSKHPTRISPHFSSHQKQQQWSERVPCYFSWQADTQWMRRVYPDLETVGLLYRLSLVCVDVCDLLWKYMKSTCLGPWGGAVLELPVMQ